MSGVAGVAGEAWESGEAGEVGEAGEARKPPYPRVTSPAEGCRRQTRPSCQPAAEQNKPAPPGPGSLYLERGGADFSRHGPRSLRTRSRVIQGCGQLYRRCMSKTTELL